MSRDNMNDNNKNKNNKKIFPNNSNIFKFILIYATIAIFMMYFYKSYVSTTSTTITYSEFLNFVKKNKIKNVTISSQYVKGTVIENGHKKLFTAVAINNPGLIKLLEQHKVNFKGTVSNTWINNLIFGWILPFGFLFFIWWLLTRKMRGTSGSLFGMGKSKFKVYLNKKPGVKFGDVAGIDEVRQEVEEIVEFLKNPEKFQRLGGRIPKGVLVVGAPGTGKTLLAKATAGEAGAPFISISGSEFIEMFVGVGASRVRDLFAEAKKLAPCIVFIDEIDAIGKSRAIGALTSNDEREQTLNQLLTEMDGFDPTTGVIIMAATNRPEVLDPALLRPGRFDRQIVVDKPDVEGREAILKVHIRNVKISEDVDLKVLAQMTPGLVGADLANIINEAALLAARENENAVHMKHFEEAIERQLAGLKKKNRVIREDEKKRIAYHESGHAIVAYLLPGSDPVKKISIVPRGLAALGYTQQLPTEERYLLTKSDMLNRLSVLFGGRAAEEIVFQDVSTGAQNDLSRATDIARAIVTQLGMNKNVGLGVYERQTKNPLMTLESFEKSDAVSEKTKEIIDEEVKKTLDEAYNKAKNLLLQNRKKMEKLAKTLIEKEIIGGEELKSVMEEDND